MAKKQGGGKQHPLPFTTFGELEALGLKARVYCSRCYEHRPIDPAADHLRDRCFATTRFRCTKIRYTGNVCGCAGSVEIEPSVLLPVGGKDDIAILSCVSCQPSWEINHVPIDQQPWSVVNRRQRPLQVPGVREGRGLADPSRGISSLRSARRAKDQVRQSLRHVPIPHYAQVGRGRSERRASPQRAVLRHNLITREVLSLS